MQPNLLIKSIKKYDFKHQPMVTATDNYPFTRQQYHLYKDDKCLAWFDIIVSDKFPVDDFDVNFLSYREGVFKSEHATKTVEELIYAIHNKEMDIIERLLNLIIRIITNLLFMLLEFAIVILKLVGQLSIMVRY